MNIRTKKWFKFIVLSCALFVFLLFSIYHANKKARITKEMAEAEREDSREETIIYFKEDLHTQRMEKITDKVCTNHLWKKGFSIFGDWLYFKAIEDSLKYAQFTTQDPTFHPESSSLEQKFKYSSGVRVGAIYQFKDKWEIDLTWMYYQAKPGTVKACSNNFGLVGVMSLPAYGIDQNTLVDQVKGRWDLKMNAVDLSLKIPLCLTKRFVLSPLGGVKAGFVRQHINVNYKDFLIVQPTANTPHKIHTNNRMWGVGPLLGLKADFILNGNFGIFFRGSVAALASQFKVETDYTDFSNAPADAKLAIEDIFRRVSVVGEWQAGLDKTWTIGKRSQLGIALGWEVQVWRQQLRVNMFDAFIEPSTGSDLTLYGPFARLWFHF